MRRLLTTYERIADRLLSLSDQPTRPYCCFENGRLLTGTKSKHQHTHARVWRLFWRLKTQRRNA